MNEKSKEVFQQIILNIMGFCKIHFFKAVLNVVFKKRAKVNIKRNVCDVFLVTNFILVNIKLKNGYKTMRKI